MFDQLLGSLLFLLGFTGSVKGESTQSAVASQSAVAQIATTLSNVFAPATKSATSSIRDGVSFDATLANRLSEWQKTWEAKRQSFMTSLVVVKDEKKRTNLLAVSDALMTTKSNACVSMRYELGALEGVLGSIKESTGSTPSATLEKLVVAAQNSLSDAYISVYALSEKDTTFVLSSGEKAIKNDALSAKKKLQEDIANAWKKVEEARKQVKKAYDVYYKETKKGLTISVAETVIQQRRRVVGKGSPTLTPTPTTQ